MYIYRHIYIPIITLMYKRIYIYAYVDIYIYIYVYGARRHALPWQLGRKATLRLLLGASLCGLHS